MADHDTPILQGLFHGGIHPAEHKEATAGRPIRELGVPEVLHVPLSQHIGNPAQAVVQAGDRVRKGDVLGKPDGFVSVPVHAPTSGTVTAVADYPAPHPSGLSAPAVTIEADGRDEWTDLEPHPDFEHLQPGEIRALVRQAGIVGLGGAGFPSFIKLNPGPDRAVDTVILNGGESEPYLTCDDRLMRERAGEILQGGSIIAYTVGAERIVVGVEANKPEAFAAMQEAAAGWPMVDVVMVENRYPMGAEKQLIQTITGREVPSGRLPADVGVVNQNVGTAYAIYRAVVHGEPLVERVLTASGAALAEPANLLVRLGTPIEEVARACGGYTDLGRLIMGGPLVGSALHATTAPVVKESNGLIFQARAEVDGALALPCIRCGACVDACPVNLMPNEMYNLARNKEFERIADYDLFDCIECGCCTYVCPSHLPLVHYYRYAKSEIQAKEREKEKADIARRRTEARDARLQREKEEKEAKRRAKKKASAKEEEGKGESGDAREAAARKAAEKRRSMRGEEAAGPEDATADSGEPSPGSDQQEPK
ncbi:electron transport complex subunit RsxC [Thiohalorhabdus denitrificans]|uniref:Ion-translocating oxidoreductase complex subunit C n=1 Tax=Thiohalorhabdus denitrificans TaxID=381306 RepID=A0A1G5FTD6_9GAMM|nr:electron transport complex subunit RsxC [Thiohalorhabdus denitrificans]SCY42632.1 electron transport complex protein RnfC [Thiohalorhabdus denitrificans]